MVTRQLNDKYIICEILNIFEQDLRIFMRWRHLPHETWALNVTYPYVMILVPDIN